MSNVEEIPEKLAQVTGAYFGLKGVLEGRPQITGLLGAIIGIHALEHATGAALTFGARLFGRGQPVGQYRGVIIRRTDRPPGLVRLGRWLRGDPSPAYDSFYFFEAGRTWRSETVTVSGQDMPRSLTVVRSFSIPHREYYFDREVQAQTVVDIVKGDLEPDTLPGFIGSVNELEDVSGAVGNVKRAMFALNWLLVDPGERDGGGGLAAEGADYAALIKGLPPAGRSKSAAENSSRREQVLSSVPAWKPTYPSTTRQADLLQKMATQSSRGRWSMANNSQPTEAMPTVDVNGIERKLVVKGVNPITGLANAAYYDETERRWKVIDDETALRQIAGEVRAGRLQTNPARWPF